MAVKWQQWIDGFNSTAAGTGCTFSVNSGAAIPDTNKSTATIASATAAVRQPVPVNVSPPVVAGTARVGSVQSPGVWLRIANGTYTYQWQRDTVDIGGATASSYTLVSGDSGHAIRVEVFAHNSGAN